MKAGRWSGSSYDAVHVEGSGHLEKNRSVALFDVEAVVGARLGRGVD